MCLRCNFLALLAREPPDPRESTDGVENLGMANIRWKNGLRELVYDCGELGECAVVVVAVYTDLPFGT